MRLLSKVFVLVKELLLVLEVIVTQDVPAGAVVVGNPARIIKEQKDEKTEGKTQLMDDLRKI